MFICLSGIDGSGKSTLAQFLVAELKQRGINCKYVYSRSQSPMLRLLNSIGRHLLLRGTDIYKDYAEHSRAKRALFQKPFFSSIYERLFLLDYLIQMIFKAKIPLMRGRNIVCDRYIYDSIITDLAVDMSYSKQKIKRLLKRCFSLLPQPDIVFLIDIPEDIAYQRKNDVPSVNYLKERRMIYLDVGQEYGMNILDGTRELAELDSEARRKCFDELRELFF